MELYLYMTRSVKGHRSFFYEKATHYAENADYPILLVDFYELQEVVESLNQDF